MMKFSRFFMSMAFFSLVFVLINSPITVFAIDPTEDDEPLVCIMMCIDDPTTEEIECNSSCPSTPLPADPSPIDEIDELYSCDNPISFFLSAGEEKWIGIKLMAGTYFMENDMWGSMDTYELFAEDLTLIPYNPVNSIQLTIDNSGYYYLHLIANREVDFHLVFRLISLYETTTEPYEGEDTITEENPTDEPIDYIDHETLTNTFEEDEFETQTEEETVLIALTGTTDERAALVFPSILFLVFAGLIVFKIVKPVVGQK